MKAARTPDIVTERIEREHRERQQQEREERAKLERQKAEHDKEQQKEKADKLAKAQAKAQAQAQQQKIETEKQKQIETQKLAKLHQENVKRMMGQIDAPADSSGATTQSAGPSANYQGRIKGRILPNIVFADTISNNPATEIEVTLAPDGTIIGRRITRSSGIRDWDEAVLRAIDRTAVLPRDENGRVYSPMTIVFRPNEAE